ncbi:MAG: ECF transporter S component [Synergistaceae bacterium]|jgi:uncharacterized membrane protein|nr:ECF transporter S component [Synergistaceae bacterium]
MKSSKKNSVAVRDFAVTSMFAAVIFLLAFTPIGFINFGVMKATIVHIPVIIGSITLGPARGALLGALFGLTSLINAHINPSFMSFAFSPIIPIPGSAEGGGNILALLVCFGPRVLVGVVPYYTNKLLSSSRRTIRLISLSAAGVAGSMTNTLLVMHLIFFIFKDACAAALNIPEAAVYSFVIGVIIGNGIPEAIAAGVFVPAVCHALLAYRRNAR